MVDIRSILFNIFICITFYYRCLISLNESVEDSKDFVKDFVVMYWLYFVHTRGRVLLKVIDNDDILFKIVCIYSKHWNFSQTKNQFINSYIRN